jgi:hypothetical protein
MRIWIPILIAAGAYLSEIFVPNRFVDVVASLLIVLWLPGAAWLEVLLNQLASRWWERLAVTVLLSAAFSVLVGLFLDVIPSGLDRRTELSAWVTLTSVGFILSNFLWWRRYAVTIGHVAETHEHSSQRSVFSSVSKAGGERKWAVASGLATLALLTVAVGWSLISANHANSANPITAISVIPTSGNEIEVLATTTDASSKPYTIVLISGASGRQVIRAHIRIGVPWVHVVAAPTFPFRAQLWKSGSGGRVLLSQIKLVGE